MLCKDLRSHELIDRKNRCALGWRGIRAVGGLRRRLHAHHDYRMGRQGRRRLPWRLGFISRQRSHLRSAMAIDGGSGIEPTPSPCMAPDFRRARARHRCEHWVGLQRTHRERDVRILARRALHLLLPARRCGVRTSLSRPRWPREDSARAHRLHDRGDRVRIAVVVHRARTRRVVVGRRTSGALVGGRLRHRRCDRDDRRRHARHADHRLARRASGRLVDDRHGSDTGGRPLVDQRRIARNLRDRGPKRYRLLRVLHLHVRRRALSARATPARRLDIRPAG